MRTNARLRLVFVCIALLGMHCAATNQRRHASGKNLMADDPFTTLQTSDDPVELAMAAVGLARSDQPQAHEAVGKSLGSAHFLGKLDTKEDYKRPRADLRVARILDALGQNRAPSAHRILVSLTKDKAFLKHESRVRLLIEAYAAVRPPPPTVVAFWDKYSGPDDSFANIILTAVVHNGSAPALALFEKYMLDDAYDRETRVSWMRSDVLPHRNEAGLLKTCEQLLMKPLPQNLNSDLVEVLFDFKAGWYVPANAKSPPRWDTYGTSARAQLRRIADYALQKMSLTDEQKGAVETTLERINPSSNRP